MKHASQPVAGEELSERVVDAVAARAEQDPLELPPLFDAIDPDALEAVVGTLEDGYVQFAYAGFDVTVRGDGVVDVRPDVQTDSEYDVISSERR